MLFHCILFILLYPVSFPASYSLGRAGLQTLSAVIAYIIVYHRQIIYYFNCAGRAGFFAFTAGDTTHRTGLHDLLA